MFFGFLAWATAFYILWQRLDRKLYFSRLLLVFTLIKLVYPLYIFLVYDPFTAGWLYGFSSPTAVVIMLLIPCLFAEGVITSHIINHISTGTINSRWFFAVPLTVISVMLVVSIDNWFMFKDDPFGITQTRHDEQLPRVAKDLARILSFSVFSNSLLGSLSLYQLFKNCSVKKLFNQFGAVGLGSHWVTRFFTLYLAVLLLNCSSYVLDIRGFLSSPIVLSINFLALSLMHLLAFVWLALVSYILLIHRVTETQTASSLQRDRYLSEPYVSQVKQYLAEHQPYLQSTISLERLAQDVGVPAKALSIIINNIYDCSFSEYIGQRRLDHAKKLLIDSPKMKIEEVAAASGFNSRSSFFSIFKKVQGCTPSTFRKQYGLH